MKYINAKYKLTKKLGNSRDSIFQDCIYALNKCGFLLNYDNIDLGLIRADTGFTWRSFGEDITIQIDVNGTVYMKSECRRFQLTAWGKNKQNINHFLKVFKEGNTQSEYV